jgi:hypothetical protein
MAGKWRCCHAALVQSAAWHGGAARSPGKVYNLRHATADYFEAPCVLRMSATSACPRRCAHARGVAQGSSSGRLVGAPRASKNSTMSGMLVRAAHARGVERYSSSRAEIDAPASSRIAARASASATCRLLPSPQSVQQHLLLPVRQIGTHPIREQNPEQFEVFEQVTAARSDHRRHPDARI